MKKENFSQFWKMRNGSTSESKYNKNAFYIWLISYYVKEQKTLLLQRDPPARDSTFLPKLYFEKARQCTLDDTLFWYETIIKTLLDTDFNKRATLLSTRSQSINNRLIRTRLNRKIILVVFPQCVNGLIFDLKPSKTPE